MSIFERIKNIFKRNKTPLLPSVQEEIKDNNEYEKFTDELKKQVVSDDDRRKIQEEIINEKQQAFINISESFAESFGDGNFANTNECIKEFADILSGTETYILKWISSIAKIIPSQTLKYFTENRKLDMLVHRIEDEFSEKVPPQFRESKMALDTYLFERDPSEYIGGIMQDDINTKDCY